MVRAWYVRPKREARISQNRKLEAGGFTSTLPEHFIKTCFSMEKLLAVTAIGPDRTGLVRDVSKAISSAGGSILQSRMTTLGQEFAILALVSGNWHAITKISDALEALRESSGLAVSVRQTAEKSLPTPAAPYSVDIVAMDQEGIVASLASFFSARDIEIADLSTRKYNAPHTGAEMFAVQLVVNVLAKTNLASLREQFHEYCEEQNLDAIIEPLQR
jgi:glycine cleavage system transcriptional repressor